MFRLIRIPMITAVIGLSACASVPDESVELSDVVGRDLEQLHQSHRELANLLYSRMRADIDRFVDEVYAPFQIRRLLEADQNDSQDGDALSLFAVMNTAATRPTDAQASKDALAAMAIFTETIHTSVEAYRADRLRPVIEQERQLLAAIDQAYGQVRQANSAVTGYLSSLVKVHQAQDELLRGAGLDRLREHVSRNLAATSDEVARLVREGTGISGNLEELEAKLDELRARLDQAVAGGTPDPRN